MGSAQRPKLIWRLVEESLSDAAFLWSRLDRALDAPDHTLPDVERWVERRLFGALDGIRLAGSSAFSPLLAEAFVDQDAGLVSTAAYVLATMRTPEALKVLESSLRELTDERVSAVASGLGRTGNAADLLALWSRVQEASSACRACVLEALTFCGAAPEAPWKSLLTAEDPVLRRAAAGALAHLPASTRSEVMWVALQSPDRDVRNGGNIAALIAGDSAAWSRCCEAVHAADVEVTRASAMLMVAMLGSRSEQAHLCKALAVPALKRHALWALGFAGTSDAVEVLLAEALAGEHTALACDAIAAITGVDLSKLPETGTSTIDDAVPSDEAQTSFDAAALERWWQNERKRFDPDARYQQGTKKTLATLRDRLRVGATQQRHAIALELSVRSRGACRVQTFGFSHEQRAQMARMDTLDSGHLREAVNVLGIEPIAEA